jgi:hypothetical protein
MRSFLGKSEVAIFLDVVGVRWLRVWASLAVVVGRSRVEVRGIQLS